MAQEKNEKGSCHKPCKPKEVCYSVYKAIIDNVTDISHVELMKKGCLNTHDDSFNRFVHILGFGYMFYNI